MTVERNPRWASVVDRSGNLHRITDSLYRSEQPLKNHIDLLKSLGVATIISFRAFHSDWRLLEEAAIRRHRIPMHTWRIRDREVEEALRCIRTAETYGAVLIHCQHGADRTGLVSAMYRMVYQGWSKEEALDELLHGGYGFHSIWKNIPNYIERLDLAAFQERLTTPVAS
jgi:protein tyrosine/serine phosphatase